MTFLWKRGIIFWKTSDTYKKSFIWILLKHYFMPHNNNLLLIPDLNIRIMMTSLWRHYWLYEHHWLLHELNKQKKYLPYKVNYDITSREVLVDLFLWNLLRLLKLLTTLEHQCCSRTKVRIGVPKSTSPFFLKSKISSVR